MANIKETIIDKKADIVLFNDDLIENISNFFTEINSIKKKTYIILISNKNLHNVDISLEKQSRWTIGSEPDAKDIIRGTGAFKSMKEYALELHKSLEEQHNSFYNCITPDCSPRTSAKIKEEDDEDDDDDDDDEDDDN